jgi:hypothetical protein
LAGRICRPVNAVGLPPDSTAASVRSRAGSAGLAILFPVKRFIMFIAEPVTVSARRKVQDRPIPDRASALRPDRRPRAARPVIPSLVRRTRPRFRRRLRCRRVPDWRRHADRGGQTSAQRIRSLTRLYTERANEQGIAIKLAIRQCARTDAMAAAAVAMLDAARVKTASSLYEGSGFRRRMQTLAPCSSMHFC